jgi:16S rRNA (adenine1518-N6/adenine1519-N6)-dimethyltransferase
MSPLASPIERVRLFHLATAAFQRKRKTISNGLSQGLDRPRADIDQWLQRAGIEPSRRPQTISLQEWILLAKMFEE